MSAITQYPPLLWPVLASVTFMLWLGLYMFCRPSVPAAKAAALLIFALGGVSFTSALGLASVNVPAEVFWNKALVWCTLPSATASLVFALQYVGMGNWLTRRVVALLAIVPCLTMLLMVTNDAHGLVWSRFWLDQGYVHFSFGTWGWVYFFYSYLLVLIHCALLVGIYARSRGLLRWQVSAILLAWFVLLGAQVLEIANLSPVEPLAVICLVSLFTAWAYAFAIFNSRMLSLVPVARGAVLENLLDGTLVLDNQNWVVDFNPAAQRLLGLQGSQEIGREAAQAFHRWPNLIELLRDPATSRNELQLGTDTAPQYYDIRLLPLADSRGFQLGQLIVLHDITELKRAQEQLLQQQRALAAFKEREQLAWELHDGISQQLAFLNTQSQAVGELLATGQSQKAQASLNRLALIARDLHGDVREMIRELSKVVPSERAFVPALRERLQQFSQDCGIHTELMVTQEQCDTTFEPVVAAQLLRIIQEALTNIRKHARAQNVCVSLAPEPTQVQVVIEDDGIGFDPEKFNGSGTEFGLRIMRERAAVIGGYLHIGSAPGEGTRVIVQVPWRSREM